MKFKVPGENATGDHEIFSYNPYGLGICHLQEAETYAQENSLFFMETSAKTATNVKDIFYEIGESFLHSRKEIPNELLVFD